MCVLNNILYCSYYCMMGGQCGKFDYFLLLVLRCEDDTDEDENIRFFSCTFKDI
jgi:hypothetical protein